MEWEPNQRDAWVSDAQRWICQINGVFQCKIDLDEAGEIGGVHVVAGMDRDPRHVVRDVEGLLKARLDLDVYYKKIGVVQVLDNSPRLESTAVLPGDEPTGGGDPVSESDAGKATVPAIPAVLVVEDAGGRVVCGGVSVMLSDTTVRAEVHLSLGEVEARGFQEGLNHADSDILLVAQATVAAVAELMVDPVIVHLREARIAEIGGQRVVLTAVDLVEGRHSTTLFGTCSTAHNQQQAVVYAVLDAVNRRLAMHGMKTLAAVE